MSQTQEVRVEIQVSPYVDCSLTDNIYTIATVHVQ